MQFRKEARGGKGGKETRGFTKSERRDYKGKDSEKSFHTVSREAKKKKKKKARFMRSRFKTRQLL